MLNKAISLAELLLFKGALSAFIRRRGFSLASYKIFRRAAEMGVHPRTIIDIGANIGQFSSIGSLFYPEARIIAVEPDPEVAKHLVDRLQHHQLLEVHNCAVGDYCGTVKFNINRDRQTSSVLELGRDRMSSFPESTVVRQAEVPISTIDALLEAREIMRPALLKIDVQGFEDRVLSGATNTLKLVDWVILEVSFIDLYRGEPHFQQLLAQLQSNGFTFKCPLNFHIAPKTGVIIEMDALFVRDFSSPHMS